MRLETPDKRLVLAVNAVLVAALCVDTVLPLMAIYSSQTWFDRLHGGIQPDALHLAFLYRCAAHWTAFALVQLTALGVWRRYPVWLAITAGARLTDVFTDATYWATAPHLSHEAWTLLVPPILNAAMAVFLLVAHRRMVRA